jgi:hypothetical protein
METIMPQTCPKEWFGQGISLGHFRHPPVERRVEANNLRQVRKISANRFQPFNFIGEMIGG